MSLEILLPPGLNENGVPTSQNPVDSEAVKIDDNLNENILRDKRTSSWAFFHEEPAININKLAKVNTKNSSCELSHTA
jgi:hypothetical protein